METTGVTFEVLVHGRPVKEYPHEGRRYVEGRKGSEFTLRIHNNTGVRVLAVVSVDGLSVMSGKVGSYDSGGYVLEPYRSLDIPGWRLNNNEVARFFFAEKGQAYASQMDMPTNIGVIGCAVFNQAYAPKWPTLTMPDILCRRPTRYGGDAPLLRGSKTFGGDTPKSIGNVGTGFGEKTGHRVVEVEFKRASTPICVLEIHYDDREGLEARGVDLQERPQVAIPNPFPAENVHGCAPPKDWRG